MLNYFFIFLVEDIESLYEVHASRREGFSKWLSNVVDEDVQAEIASAKTKVSFALSFFRCVGLLIIDILQGLIS